MMMLLLHGGVLVNLLSIVSFISHAGTGPSGPRDANGKL
jgi:hypothetical protein